MYIHIYLNIYIYIYIYIYAYRLLYKYLHLIYFSYFTLNLHPVTLKNNDIRLPIY